jgi:prophage antirepressor-like protein
MLNIFRSPRKQEHIVIQDEASLLVKQFNGLNIRVYGTYEEPLFKAKDIGELLEMSNIREVIKNFNNKQRCDVSLTDAIGRQQITTFLTEQGLYKVLMRSRKKIAEQFQDWVCEVVEEIRKKGKYDLQEQLKQKELEYQKQIQAKEQELLKYKEKTYEEIEKTGHIYVIKTDGGTKVGKTKDVLSKRTKGLQTGNVNDIEVILDFQTSNADLLEKCIHYILDRYRCNSNREFFDYVPTRRFSSSCFLLS